MRVLFATAELAPLARVGGLAEASSGLTRALGARADVTVDVVLPDYGDVELTGERTTVLDVPEWAAPARARTGQAAGVGPVTLISTAGMARPHPYTDAGGAVWSDNDQRFLGFSAALADLVGRRRPDLLHLNDWHTAATPAFLAPGRRPPIVLTIHTLAYQGTTDRSWSARLPHAREQYERDGAMNPLAGAIDLAQRVIAVSPTYASEMRRPETGMGLHEPLKALGDRLVGIRNGIDVDEWNPATDPLIAHPFHTDDLTGKAACRSALCDVAGWVDDPDRPIIGAVTRLVDQKGIDLLAGVAPYLAGIGVRLFVLGSGDAGLTRLLRAVAEDQRDRVAFVEGYDAALAHRIFAGADLFAMPSRFEPCGLAQMQAMRYGTIPVVSPVGGLVDTVVDADVHPTTGNGFAMHSVDTAGLVDAIHRAVRAWHDHSRRVTIQQRGMRTDWSWTEPAAAHVDIYRALLTGARDR